MKHTGEFFIKHGNEVTLIFIQDGFITYSVTMPYNNTFKKNLEVSNEVIRVNKATLELA